MTTKNRITNNPYILMFVILIFWGSFTAVSKLTLQRMDSFQTQFYMFGSAFIIMTFILIFNGKMKEFKKLSKKEYLKLFLFSLPSFFYYFLYILALMLIPTAEASMLNYLFPVMIILFAIPIHKEKFDVPKLITVLLGFLGMAIILTNGQIGSFKLSNLFGDILAVSAAALWGIFSNLGKKSKVDNFISNYVYVAVAFVLSGISMFVFSGFTVPDAPALAGVLWIGVTNIVLGYFLWFKVLKIAPTILVSSLSFVTPFVTLVFIMLLLGEKIYFMQVVGLMVIMVGVAVQSIVDANKRKLMNQGSVVAPAHE